ncbi:hypothetical protein OROMI_025891 [Orobanche minor]
MEELFDEQFPETIYNLKSFHQLEKDKENSQFFLFGDWQDYFMSASLFGNRVRKKDGVHTRRSCQ